jgi:D-alanine-D-alanine ligase
MDKESGGGILKIAVLLGGDSPERDVSIVTGMEVAKALVRGGHDVRTVDPALPGNEQYGIGESAIGPAPPEESPAIDAERSRDWLNWDAVREADLVFVALHGGKGENGTVQALLESAGCIYTGAGVLGSALAMDKDRSKALMREAGVHTARHILLRWSGSLALEDLTAGIEEDIGFPVVVKPNSQGSSVGFSFVEKPAELGAAIETGLRFDDELMVEEYIPGRELTVAVLGETPLSPVEIIPEGGFYDYKSKYTKGCSRYVVPAEISKECAGKLQAEGVLAFRALRCRDYARIDFRVDEKERIYCLELNTLPGMTGLSLVPMAAAERGISFEALVERICRMALARG